MIAAVVLAAVLAGGWAFHPRILRTVGGLLIVESDPALAQAMLIVHGDRRFDAAAKLYRQGATKVLLYRLRPKRLERLGILPTSEEVARRELRKRGIPDDAVVLLDDDRQFRDWLKQNPDQTVRVLCDRFSSRTCRLHYDRMAGESVIQRIRFAALPHRRYDETNWWRSKAGAVALLNGGLRLGFHWMQPGEGPDERECTDADFRRAAFEGPPE